MRDIGLSDLFARWSAVPDEETSGTKKAAKSSAVAGGIATVRTRPMDVDLAPGFAGNDEAKARMEVMLALAQSGHFNSYASVLKSQTAELETTSSRAKVYTDQMTDLIGGLHDMQGRQNAAALQSDADSRPSRVRNTADIWAATIANYTANAAPAALHGTDRKLQETQSDLVQSLTAAGMQNDVADDVAAALACSTHLAATMTVADPADSETVQTIPHDPTACASKIVDSMIDRLPAALQGSLNAQRSKVVTVLANLHEEVHGEVLSHLAKANLHDVVSDRVRKLLDQTPHLDDTAADAERDGQPRAERLATERRLDPDKAQELAPSSSQERDERARSVS